MRVVRFAVALLAVTLIHLVAQRIDPGAARFIDLFVVLVALNALDGDSLAGMLGGLAAGLVHDALAGGPYGLYGFADTIIGYLTARAGQRLVVENAGGAMLMVGVAAAAQEGLLAALALLLLAGDEMPPLVSSAVKVLTGGLAGLLLYRAAHLLASARERRRRGRNERLRL